jgi:pyridoxine/pyridoxamine 5'-phosphate oxidase
VIAKDFGEEGFIFFTSYKSKKAQELDTNPQASCCFYWDPLDRQVTMKGQVRKISREQSIDYFSKRPFESRISSYISDQGKIIKDKQYLIEAKEKASKEFEGQEVPTPEHW